MATLTTLRNAVASKVGLTNAVGNEQTLLDEWINQGILDILYRTAVNVDDTTLNLTAGTGDYTLDAGILRIMDAYVTSGGTAHRFERISADELLDRRRTGISASPSRYYAMRGAHLFMVYPPPSVAAVVTLYYVPRPTALSTGADDPSSATKGGIPVEFHKAIEYYALWQAGEYDQTQTSQAGQTFLALYEGELKKIRTALQRKPGDRMAPARLRRRRYAHAEPDRY